MIWISLCFHFTYATISYTVLEYQNANERNMKRYIYKNIEYLSNIIIYVKNMYMYKKYMCIRK